MRFLLRNKFGLAILACAVVSFSFPVAFTSWGGVKLTKLVTPAIQVIMFGTGTTLTLADFARVAKCPWAVATGVFLQFLIMPLVWFTLALAFVFSGELAAGCVLIGSVTGGGPKTEMWCALSDGPIYAGLREGMTAADVEADGKRVIEGTSVLIPPSRFAPRRMNVVEIDFSDYERKPLEPASHCRSVVLKWS